MEENIVSESLHTGFLVKWITAYIGALDLSLLHVILFHQNNAFK